MTGGQMAPTTLPGQVTQTTPYGRITDIEGFPVKMYEMLSQLDGVALAQRVTVIDPANIRKAKAAIRKGFEYQKNKQGFSIIEVLSTCPTNWGLTPVQAIERLKNDMIPYYPLGVYKDGAVRNKEAAAQ
jgi:2-oxoglutarate ferredoxin oxidoreductase subunit beta